MCIKTVCVGGFEEAMVELERFAHEGAVCLDVTFQTKVTDPRSLKVLKEAFLQLAKCALQDKGSRKWVNVRISKA